MKALLFFVPTVALTGILFSMIPPVVPPPGPARNPDLIFNPNPPVAGENLTIEIEWPFYVWGDEITIKVDFDPVGSDIEVTVKKPGSAVIAIPKGATKVTASDKSHNANTVSAPVSN